MVKKPRLHLKRPKQPKTQNKKTMTAQTKFNLEDIIKRGKINSEIEFQRLKPFYFRLKEKDKKLKLSKIIAKWEEEHWSNEDEISDDDVRVSDYAQLIAEKESLFVVQRKRLIKEKLKQLGIKQTVLQRLLGLKSETHMSEIINGHAPFTLNHVVIINRLLKIPMSKLIFGYVEEKDVVRIKRVTSEENIKIKLKKDVLELV